MCSLLVCSHLKEKQLVKYGIEKTNSLLNLTLKLKIILMAIHTKVLPVEANKAVLNVAKKRSCKYKIFPQAILSLYIIRERSSKNDGGMPAEKGVAQVTVAKVPAMLGQNNFYN